MEYIIVSVFGLLSLTTISALLIVYGYRERRLKKRIEMIEHFVSHNYTWTNDEIEAIK